jgi:hypothetical protein
MRSLKKFLILAFATFYRLRLGKGTPSRPWRFFLEIMQNSAKFARREFDWLLFLLESYREMKSTDPRDKVFAILRIATQRMWIH